MNVTLAVNGEERRLDVDPTEFLSDTIRNRLELKGTNLDCCLGICGACTVLLDGRPVSSCLLLTVQVDGHSVMTVEGLEGDGTLHPLQDAFLRHGAVQCGYCTPGMLMTASALLTENPKASRDEILDDLRGNLCRCTGYKKIVDAVEACRDEIV